MISYICIGLIIIGCLRLMIGSYKELGVICAALGIIGLIAFCDDPKETPKPVTVPEKIVHDTVYVEPEVYHEEDCCYDAETEDTIPEDTVETPRDTIYMHDTLTVYETDTLYKTITTHDTIYVEIPVESDVDLVESDTRPNWKRPE